METVIQSSTANVRWWGLFRLACPLLLIALAIGPLHRARAAEPVTANGREYQVKAVFLFNFAQFIEWPSSAFANDEEPLVIGVLGNDPFGAALDQTVKGERIRGRPLVVRRARQIDDLQMCHMLFICAAEAKKMPEVLARLAGRPVVTVSEVAGFAARGGMFNFFLKDGKVRFEINQEATRCGGLKVSSQLLSLGRLVQAKESP